MKMSSAVVFLGILSICASHVIRRETDDGDVALVEGDNVAPNGKQIENQKYSRQTKFVSHVPETTYHGQNDIVDGYYDGSHGHSHGRGFGRGYGQGVVVHHGAVSHNGHDIDYGHSIVHNRGFAHHRHGQAVHKLLRHSSHRALHHPHHAVVDRFITVPSRHVHLGHEHVQGVGKTINEGSTYSSSIARTKASDELHKHVHNDIIHLAAHHHDHTNLHKNIHDIHNYVHDHHKHIKEYHNHIHDKTHDHTLYHDHRTEDHQHEQHNFETHDSSATATDEHIDHGVKVIHGQGRGNGLHHAHDHSHHHVVVPDVQTTYEHHVQPHHIAHPAHRHDLPHHSVHHDNRHLGHDHQFGHDIILGKLQVAPAKE